MSRTRVGEKFVLVACLGVAAIVVGILLARFSSKQDEGPEFRERSLTILRNTLRENNPFARGAAAKAMGDSRDPAVLPWLETAAKDPNSTVRLFAVEAAANFGSRTAIRFI